MSDHTSSMTPTFGFPEFWQKVHDSYDAFFQAAHKLEALANSILKAAEGKITEPSEYIVFILARITVVGFNELIILAGNGAGPGAMKISRSMFESSTCAEYLRLNPAEVTDYLEFRHILNWRRYQWLLATSPDSAKEITVERAKELEESYRRTAPRFQNRKGKVRNQWHRKSIAEMANDVGRREQYELPYTYAASIHHSNPEGLLAYVDVEEGTPVLDNPPSVAWVGEALIGGHSYVLQSLDTLNECLKLGFENQVKEAVEDFKRVWAKERAQDH